MSDKTPKQPSRFKFGPIDLSFTSENWWQKLLIYLISLVALAVCLWLLNRYAIHGLLLEKLSRIKLGAVLAWLRNRSP